MKPTWEREGIQLYLGDCLEVLPHLGKVDAVVTDPPYGINGSSGTVGKAREKGEYGVNFKDTKEYVRERVIPAFRYALEISHRAAVTPGNRMAIEYPPPDEIGCFWQPATPGVGPWGYCTMQPIFYYGRDPRLGKGQQPSGRVVTERPEGLNHPCPKPLGSWMWLIDKVSLPGETVLDLFGGSGTTIEACVKLGRKCIVIEMVPEFFDLMVWRAERALSEERSSLFPVAKEVQASLFERS